MTKLTFRKPSETKQTTERAARRHGWAIARYAFLTACGFVLYRAGAACALAQRGYIAMGGEVFLLILPLFYYLFSTLLRDMIRDVTTDRAAGKASSTDENTS